MKGDDLEKRLENLNVTSVVPPEMRELKLAIVNAKKSARLSLWLLCIPFLVLLGALIDSLFHISLPPWSILKQYGGAWPVWMRVSIFITVLIVIPSAAVLLNLLAILFVHYDRKQKVLHIAVRFKRINIIILLIAGIIAILFIGHSLAEWLTGAQ
jgi:hypothetical protein